MAPKNEPGSVTESVMESESEPEAPSALAKPTPILPPPKYEPSSVTEPESDIEDLPQPLPQPSIKNLPKNNPSSVTEPESDIEDLPINTPIKKKSFFDTPSPPGPDSCYWNFLTVHQIKQDLKDLQS
ncbi:hypothetical protein F4604DRAFT_1927005 [Suillus subluteus]|nr:hypothetical protein F4604DRAFT_1927005 [Suillus subluteus]